VTLIQEALLANLLYLTLVAGLWLAALAVVSPGTGVLELLAFLALAATGVGTFVLPLNLWAVFVLGLGVVLFGLSLWRRREELWLGLSAVSFSLGSVFLFRLESGGPAVHPVLASIVSVLTLGFFWLMVRKTMAAQRARPAFNPSDIVGQVGEARTAIDPTGSVYAGRELWSARSETPIPVGTRVRVRGLEGLVLWVEPVEETSVPTQRRQLKCRN
jgi:membrane-bound serine protease (ClpP class)